MKTAQLEIGLLRISCCEERVRSKEPEELFLQIRDAPEAKYFTAKHTN
ncbi:hypothetical protein [Microcoleus sp. F4-D5]